MANFNALGNSHTTSSKRAEHPGMASGPARTRMALQLLAKTNVDIVGLQEFQSPQRAEFGRAGSRSWQMIAGGTKGNSANNAVAWRVDRWKMISHQAFNYRYFHGQRVTAPVVLLQNLSTGAKVWVSSVHNPAETWFSRGNARWREAAKAAEIKAVNQLRRTGIPVILTGDMNERASFMCALTRSAAMVSADGGNYSAGACHQAAGTQWIDWILGTNVRFDGYTRNWSAEVKRASDHPLVFANATVTTAS